MTAQLQLGVARALSEGTDLTTASMSVGFASPSHFSDSFLRMFGLTATALTATGATISLEVASRTAHVGEPTVYACVHSGCSWANGVGGSGVAEESDAYDRRPGVGSTGFVTQYRHLPNEPPQPY